MERSEKKVKLACGREGNILSGQKEDRQPFFNNVALA